MKHSLKPVFIALVIFQMISCTKEPLTTPQSVSVQTEENAVAQITKHYIGERYGGGIVFYVCSTGRHGFIIDTVDLETHLSKLPGYTNWSNRTIGTDIYVGTERALGTGKANTRKILRKLGTTGEYAALLCINSVRGGYHDWYLPSLDEWAALVQSKIDYSAENSYYWTSSEDGSAYYTALVMKITGATVSEPKQDYEAVRAIRSF